MQSCKTVVSIWLLLGMLVFPALGQTPSSREKVKASRTRISADSSDTQISWGPVRTALRARSAAAVARVCRIYPSAIANLLKVPVTRSRRPLQTDTVGRELRGINETQRQIDNQIRDMRGMVERIKRIDRRLMR
ncbi:MAG: hypothetical protein ACOYXY_18820 [Thermodesulfobacteriota bacterium]